MLQREKCLFSTMQLRHGNRKGQREFCWEMGAHSNFPHRFSPSAVPVTWPVCAGYMSNAAPHASNLVRAAVGAIQDTFAAYHWMAETRGLPAALALAASDVATWAKAGPWTAWWYAIASPPYAACHATPTPPHATSQAKATPPHACQPRPMPLGNKRRQERMALELS
jgi:hypothetical protein